MAANNSPSPPVTEDYSTLEVDNRAEYQHQAPQVAHDRENLPEVAHEQNSYPEVNTQAYPAAYPAAYNSGYAPGYAAGGYVAKEDGPYVAAAADQPAETTAAAAAAAEAKDSRICGVRRKTFIILATLAALIVVGVVVGVAVGVTVGNSGSEDDDSQAAEDGDTSPSSSAPPNNVRLNTRIASTNFTDDAGNNNYVLIYQLNSGALCMSHTHMSTYNTSEDQSEWIVSPVIDGKTGSMSLDDVANSTSIAIDAYVNQGNRLMHLYWLAPNNRIRSARFDMFTTDVAHNAQDWYEAPASDLYSTSPGSSIVSYGRECLDDPCPQWSYLFWQESDAVRGAGLEPGGQWESLGPRLGASSGGFDSNGVTPPSDNTSMAIALSRANTSDAGLRSLSIFYRTESGTLGQIIYDRDRADTPYRGYTLPRENLGPNTAIVALPSGTNDTERSGAEPLGFQVLTADPDAGGVQLTYYRDDEWTAAGGEVSSLSDCAPLASMAAIRGGRVYCVVEVGDGDDRQGSIVEYAWESDPADDVGSYTKYRRVGTVNTTVK